GSVEYRAEDGRTATLAMIQQYVYNQGSGWDYTLSYLDRFFEDIARAAPTATGPDVHDGYAALMRTLGVRTAELHAAFARSTGDPAFEPVPFGPTDVVAWAERVRRGATEAVGRLGPGGDALPEAARPRAARVRAQRGP